MKKTTATARRIDETLNNARTDINVFTAQSADQLARALSKNDPDTLREAASYIRAKKAQNMDVRSQLWSAATSAKRSAAAYRTRNNESAAAEMSARADACYALANACNEANAIMDGYQLTADRAADEVFMQQVESATQEQESAAPATMQEAHESDSAKAARAALADASAEALAIIAHTMGITYDQTPNPRSMRVSIAAFLAERYGNNAASIASTKARVAQRIADKRAARKTVESEDTMPKTPAAPKQDPKTVESEDTMPKTPAAPKQDQDPTVDPLGIFAYASDYDAICSTESPAYSVWQVVTTYTSGSGKSAKVAAINDSGIIASPTDILPPLELTRRIVGGESVRDVFGTDNPRTIARTIAHAIDVEQTAQHSGAELARYARLLGSTFVQVRETREGVSYTQRAMRATAWSKEVLAPLFAADAAPYLAAHAAIDGTRRKMQTQAIPHAEGISGASFVAQRRHVATRKDKRNARAALHNALAAAATAAQDAAAALAAQDAAAALAAQDAAQVAARAAQDAAHILDTPRAHEDAAAARAYALAAQSAARESAALTTA